MALINTTTTGVLGTTVFGDGSGDLTIQQNGVLVNKITSNGLTYRGTGSVLQVVQTVKTSVFTTTSLSPTDVTGMSVSITPTSASNKILVMFYVGLVGNTTSGQGTELWLLRDSTQLNTGDTDGVRTRVTAAQVNGGANYDSTPVAITFLDSPSTTSATTYKIQLATQDAGTAVFNRRGDDASSSASYQRSGASIIAMEIAG